MIHTAHLVLIAACNGAGGLAEVFADMTPSDCYQHEVTCQADAQEPPNPCPSLLPSMHEISPAQAANSQTAAKDVRALAGKLLGQVSTITPAWHARVPVRQPAVYERRCSQTAQ